MPVLSHQAMANNEKSSKSLGSLAGKVLHDPKLSAPAKKLAGFLLTQMPAPAKKK